MLNFDLQNHRPLREIVYEQLKFQILTGKITPGTRMMEVELAEEMGVSRTPVREAIRKLEKEGMVSIEPRRGAYASDISVKDMVDILEVREDLEGLAASLAAERITEEQTEELRRITKGYSDAIQNSDTEQMIHFDELFHKHIVGCTGNNTLIQLSENMPVEHKQIIDAITSGDGQTARIVADEHVEKLKEFVLRAGENAFKAAEN